MYFGFTVNVERIFSMSCLDFAVINNFIKKDSKCWILSGLVSQDFCNMYTTDSILLDFFQLLINDDSSLSAKI